MRLINLIPLQEIDFPNQRAFDSYNKIHKLRPDTKVVVAGRVTTAGRASQNSPSPVKGTSVFGGDDKEKAVNKEKYPVGTKFFKPSGNQNIEVVRVEGDKIFVVSDIMPGKEWQWREDGIDDDIKNQKLQVKSDVSPIPKAEPGSFLDAFQKINPGYDANKTLADFSKESEADLYDTDSDPEDIADHEAYVKSATEWFNKVATTKPTVKPGDLVKVNMKSTGKEGIGKIVKLITMQGNYGFMGQVAPDKQPGWKIDCYTEKNIGTDKKPIDVNGKKYYYQGTLYYPQHEEGDKEAFSKLGGDKESDAEVDAQKDYYNKKENTIKLINLIPLKEDDIVKNKKTGNVYVVKKMDPAKHDKPNPAEVEKAKQTNGGQLPKGEQPSKPSPQQPQQQKPQGQKLSADDFKLPAEKGSNGGKTPSNYAFTPKDAEKKYKSAAISMLIPKLNPKDIPNIQKQLSKMDVEADFNVEKDGVRVWTRSGDYSNVGDVLKSKGLKRKQTMPTDVDYQKWDDKLRASSGIKPMGGDKKPDASLNGISTSNKSKPEDLVPSVTNHLNKVSGGEGYAQKDEGGAIAYNMGDGDMPTYTLYMGKEFGKHRVSLEPTYGNDPKKLQGKIDKSFNNPKDAIKFMGDVAKKHRKELEMQDRPKNFKK